MHDPRVPETLEGWAILHQMFRVRWTDWQALNAAGRKTRAVEAAAALAAMTGDGGATAATTLLGHKGDLMLVHFRRGFEGLQAAQLEVARGALAAFLEPTTSYVSVVELGMYEMTAQIHARLGGQGADAPAPRSSRPPSTARWRSSAGASKGACSWRCPPRRYVCFYPMNKRRGETSNWYAVPVEERARMMRDHGVIGRHYAGAVTQIISGSIGFDDWEWGVDLFADDPVVFKKLIYEMRFDEASAWYAEFGPFYIGLQFSPAELPRFLEGRGARADPAPPAPPA